jgi:hypothetical protein
MHGREVWVAQHSCWSDVQLTIASKERFDGEGGGAECIQSINDGGNYRQRAAVSGFVSRCAPDGYELVLLVP